MLDRSFLDWPFFEKRHKDLADQIESWCAKNLKQPLAGSDANEQTKAAARLLGQGGWFKYMVPKSYGGVSDKIDARSLCLLRETIARHSGIADSAFALQGLGSYAVTAFGSDELKGRFLSGVGDGTLIPAFALSEENAGSDVASLGMSATLDGDHYVLNGSKTWISNAGIADFYVVFVRTGDAPGGKGLSGLVVEADRKGLVVKNDIEIMAPHSIGSLYFENCRIPASNLLGESGRGMRIALSTLDLFRSSVGAAALGFARKAMNLASARCVNRKLFGQRLADFQMTQGKLADMALAIDTSALLVYRAAWAKDSGAERITRESSMAKLHATETAQQVIDQAVQLFGGQGVVAGHPIEELYREIRPLRIYEGASEIQKLVIAREILKSQEA